MPPPPSLLTVGLVCKENPPLYDERGRVEVCEPNVRRNARTDCAQGVVDLHIHKKTQAIIDVFIDTRSQN
ncbi:hypothetical protein [Actinotignum urinale]|uniref:hypothetical protein n=1 Tax=Actinotignum urinale TaxID=190146 RepID=UPI0003B4BF8A|nr:hypothetical protein [Actinotignum urinale]MDY5128606.1 hypothetical protein [Actinotignum urinale]MDY5159765.1 hypothetical protein [Actinotignum urinale]